MKTKLNLGISYCAHIGATDTHIYLTNLEGTRCQFIELTPEVNKEIDEAQQQFDFASIERFLAVAPRWPPQTAPLMAGQTAPGRTVGL